MPYHFAGIVFARYATWWGKRRAWRLHVSLERWER
jgi:hypothetical protein